MSRLSIEVTDEQHQQLKAIAALKGMSMKDYILSRTLILEEKDILSELRQILAPRIQAARQESTSSCSIEQIIQKAHQQIRPN